MKQEGIWVMAKKIGSTYDPSRHRIKKRTSIGQSPRSRPKNKSKRLSWKRTRGQGQCLREKNASGIYMRRYVKNL